MMNRLNDLLHGKLGHTHFISVTTLCLLLSACGGGGGSSDQPTPSSSNSISSSNSSSSNGNIPSTTLSCNGFPTTVPVSVNGALQNYSKVCLILQEYAPMTPAFSVTTNAGNLLAHGDSVDMLGTFVVYARVVVTAANEGTATALARSVVVNIADGKVSSSPTELTEPESLEVDFEVFTLPSTNLTLNANAGNLTADNYSAILNLTTSAGNADLSAVQGQETVNVNAGNINVTFSGPSQGQEIFNTNNGNINVTLIGTSFTGAGMTAKVTNAGNVMVSRPVGFQAAFTAQTNVGTAAIDGQEQMAPVPNSPAIVTSGTGAPILLQTNTGNVSVTN